MICPNKNSQEWKDLVAAKNGNEDEAYKEFIKNNFETPDSNLFTPVNELDKLITDVKIFIQNRIEQLNRTQIKNKTLHTNRLTRLQKALDTLNSAGALNMIVQDAYERFHGNEEESGALSKFLDFIKNADGKDPHDLISTAVFYNEFAHSYDILDDLKEGLNVDVLADEAKKKEPGQLSTLDKLALAIRAKETLKDSYNKQIKPLMAKVLNTEKSERLNEHAKETVQPIIDRLTKQMDKLREDKEMDKEKKKKKIEKLVKEINELKAKMKTGSFEEKDLEHMLSDVSKDTGIMEYLFSPLISSAQTPLALFAKHVKSKFEDARMAVIDFKHELDGAYDKFVKASGRGKNNTAKLNDPLVDKVTEYKYNRETGKIDEETTMQFVQELDVTAYTLAKAQMLQKVDKMEDAKEAIAYRNNWFKTHHKPLSDEEITLKLAEKQKEFNEGVITEDEFSEWMRKNTRMDEEGNIIDYRGELTTPITSHFPSAKYSALSGADRDYYDFQIDQHFKLQKELPESFQIGYRLWSIPKDTRDMFLEGKGKQATKAAVDRLVNFKEEDQDRYGTSSSSGALKYVPIYFTHKMSADEVSTDLYQSSLVATGMIEKYKAASEIRPEAEAMKSIYKWRTETKKTATEDGSGNTIWDKSAKAIGIDKLLGTDKKNWSEAQLNSFIDNVIYGEGNIKWSMFGYSADKIADALMKSTAMTTLGFDFVKNITNWGQGNIAIAIEAASKEFFSPKNLAKGKAFYWKNIGSMVNDFSKTGVESLAGQIMEHYDALQGEYMDHLGRNVSGNAAKKLFTSDAAFFGQHFGEHEIQGASLFAMLDATKVKTANGEEMSLLDAYEIGPDGKLKLKDGVQFTDKQKKELQNTLHAMSKRMHGIYNSFDKPEAQRHTLGKLAFMFRKFVVPGYKKRFKALGADQELGGMTEGTYITFFRTVVRDLKASKGKALVNWSEYTPLERKNLMRFYTEAGTMVALMGMVIALKGLGDDDKNLKKKWMYSFMLYQAMRLRSEMMFYTNPKDTFRILKSPTAASTQVERIGKFISQIITNPMEEYKRDAGKFHKGDNKAFAQLQKILGLSGSNLHPDQAVKILEMYD